MSLAMLCDAVWQVFGITLGICLSVLAVVAAYALLMALWEGIHS